tara:strand:- start:5114 stop:5794 length:681 start_codon:yes stop_codon:yes gene_type:complete
MSRKPYQIKEWNDLFLSISYEKHIDLLVVLGIIYKSSEGEEAIRDADLSGDSIILTRLMNNAESFAEAFEGIDIERLFYTYFSEEQYEAMLIEEWCNDIWSKKGLENHKFLTKWKDLFKLFPISDQQKKDLPDGNFTVYRAGSTNGISWTINKGIASWFWIKNKSIKSEPKYNRFLSMRVTKDDVIFYHNARGEDEVILIPNENKVEIIPYKEFKEFEQLEPIKNM